MGIFSIFRAKYLPGDKVYLVNDRGDRVAAQVVYSAIKWSMGHPIPQRCYAVAEVVARGVKRDFVLNVHESRLSRIEVMEQKRSVGR